MRRRGPGPDTSWSARLRTGRVHELPSAYPGAAGPPGPRTPARDSHPDGGGTGAPRLQDGARWVDPAGVRVSFLVYGVVYVVIEMVGAALEDVGWARITALDVATAITDACLAVALVLAALLAVKLGAQRWGGT